MSDTIKKVLKEKNLNPSDLARMIGYTPQYVHNLLDGNRRWNETTIDKACTALGLGIEFTIGKPKGGGIDGDE
ncbi:plasmid maintenance system antidote protein VapI [Paenibacillus sp. DS2015]|uniref:helix-turn-helix domain-containing protein n=1 Tax=Paenibacillus sp. DS2015 TaxID=3373917 RepID=UPI003D1EE53E